jgi:DNA invertase Pin-like site-specific DNA recombinase
MSEHDARQHAVAFIRVNHGAAVSEAAFQQNIDWQREKCERLAQDRELTIIREYLDEGGGVSLERRPVLRDMLAELLTLRDAASVIATDEARISRKISELQYIRLQLEAAGASLVTARYASLSPAAQELDKKLAAVVPHYYAQAMSTEGGER